jgi:hypothetical protein
MIVTFDGASGAILPSIQRDLAIDTTLMANQQYPLLGALMSGLGRDAVSTKIEWQDYGLQARFVTTGAGQLDTAADTTITLTTGSVEGLISARTVLGVDGTQELIRVTGVSSNVLTVTRGFGGTTAAVIPSGTKLFVINEGWLEGEDFSERNKHIPVQRFNYTEIFRSDFKISGTLLATPLATSYNGANRQVSIELGLHQREIVDKMAQAILYGAAPATNTQGTATTERRMDGIITMIREGAAAAQGAVYTNIASADFNQSTNAYKNFVNHMETLWEKGSTARTVVVNSRIKKQLSTNMENGRQNFDVRTVARNVQEIETDFGKFTLMLDNSMRKDGLLTLDMDKVELRAYNERSLFILPMGIGGDSQRYSLLGEYTLEARDAATGGHGYFYGAAA